jgi:hypothetical protein
VIRAHAKGPVRVIAAQPSLLSAVRAFEHGSCGAPASCCDRLFAERSVVMQSACSCARDAIGCMTHERSTQRAPGHRLRPHAAKDLPQETRHRRQHLQRFRRIATVA